MGEIQHEKSQKDPVTEVETGKGFAAERLRKVRRRNRALG